MNFVLCIFFCAVMQVMLTTSCRAWEKVSPLLIDNLDGCSWSWSQESNLILEHGCDNCCHPALSTAVGWGNGSGSWKASLEHDGLFLKCWEEGQGRHGAKTLLHTGIAKVATHIPAAIAMNQRQLLHNQPDARLQCLRTLLCRTSNPGLHSLTHQLHSKEMLPCQCQKVLQGLWH